MTVSVFLQSQSETIEPGLFSGPPLTFALVGGVGAEGVAVETVLAAVAEEAIGVVDALQTLSGLTVAVADGVGVDVVAALAGAAGSDRPALTQRVAKETVVTELTALTCGRVTSETIRIMYR